MNKISFQPFVIGVAGGSGSGKSTVTQQVLASFGAEMVSVVMQDDYYCDQSELSPEVRRKQTYDHPQAFDWPLLVQHEVMLRGQPFAGPCVLLSGGETTVTVRGAGRGGRNVEFLLSLGIALDGLAGIHAMACDTDGVDGQEEIAGAYLAPDSLARAREQGINAKASLADNDGHGFFQALGDSVICGPTLTNVNDFRAIYVESP